MLVYRNYSAAGRDCKGDKGGRSFESADCISGRSAVRVPSARGMTGYFRFLRNKNICYAPLAGAAASAADAQNVPRPSIAPMKTERAFSANVPIDFLSRGGSQGTDDEELVRRRNELRCGLRRLKGFNPLRIPSRSRGGMVAGIRKGAVSLRGGSFAIQKRHSGCTNPSAGGKM